MRTSEFIKGQLELLDFNTILEVGSAQGRVTKVILDNFAVSKYTCCDLDVEACIELQEKLYGEYVNLSCHAIDYLKLVTGGKYADIVLAVHVIEAAEWFESSGVKILDKMRNDSKKYVIHTCNDSPFYQEYWSKQKDWSVTGLNVDEERKVIIAERI